MLYINARTLMLICLILPAVDSFAGIGRLKIPDPSREIARAEARLKTVLGGRCEDIPDLTPAQCAQTRHDAYRDGCINFWEREVATSNAWATFCAGSSLKFVCPCSCFDASTKIMGNTLSAPDWIDAAEVSEDDRLVALSSTATITTMDRLDSWVTKGLRWVTAGPEEYDMYVFKLSTGKELSITQNHAVLLATGVVKAAKDIKTSDRLVNIEGDPVEIVEISRRPAEDGNVYNFLVDSDDQENHLIVAEGVVVGDSIWQDHFGELLDKIFIRR